jgi:restriction system protein
MRSSSVGGGFTKVALSEASRAHFKVRLWDSGDVVAAVQDNYEQLPATIRAEIPLKRVWTLVPDEEDA